MYSKCAGCPGETRLGDAGCSVLPIRNTLVDAVPKFRMRALEKTHGMLLSHRKFKECCINTITPCPALRHSGEESQRARALLVVHARGHHNAANPVAWWLLVKGPAGWVDIRECLENMTVGPLSCAHAIYHLW